MVFYRKLFLGDKNYKKNHLMYLNFLAVLHMALSLRIILCALCLPLLVIIIGSDISLASPTIFFPLIVAPSSV